MKRRMFAAVALAAGSASVYAHTSAVDSLKNVQMDEVEIVATRATSKTPVAFTNVSGQQLKSINHGRDIPSLLSLTPSVITTSDAGTGLGYTSIRVRGTDPTRINITTNGIPMNDAESNNVYWVNTPDLVSSLKDVQIQRGAGTSTNGAGAFGASINMQTDNPSFKPMVQFDGSYGSFNTHKETLKASTGLLGNHWAFDARLSNIQSDGYIDRAWVKLRSFMVQGGYYDENTSLKLIVFGGGERTYHAWNYATREQMEKYGRTFNSCGLYEDENGKIRYYDNQIDKYAQTHYQLHLNHSFSQNFSLNAALHYTKGGGYYEEYKPEASLKKYLIQSSVEESDLIRRKEMDNDFYGGIFSLKYKNNRWDAVLGGGLNRYVGEHFGNVLSVKALPDFKKHEYYRNDGTKTDGNIYLKATYNINNHFNLYGDLQYRFVNYKINGANENFNKHSGEMQQLNVNDKFRFFNPKFGLNWDLNTMNRLYASFAMVNKEPVRNNYTDGKFGVYPKSERLMDYEAGYEYRGKVVGLGVNLYYMRYKDQLVLTGETNEIGEALTANVPNSYRTGIELTTVIKPAKWYDFSGNATLSRNRIIDFKEVLYDGDEKAYTFEHGDTPIAYSPDFIFNVGHNFHFGKFNASLLSQYVSKQYMTNAKEENITLDSYFTTNLDMNYQFKFKPVRQAKVGVTVYNLLNSIYENNGYGYSWIEVENNQLVRKSKVYYSAQAGINFLAYLSLTF